MLTRQRDLLKWFFGVLATSLIVLGLAWLFESQQPGSKASLQKEAILNEHRDRSPASVPAGQGKGGGSIAIALTPVGTASAGSLTLKASIEAQADLTDLKFQWVLPPGVSVPSGQAEGDLGNLTAGESKEIESTFALSSDLNYQIHLQVFTFVDGEKLGEVVQFNTLQQEAINRSVASKRERLDTQVSEGAQKPKLIH